MRITSLSLTNFRSFRSTQTIDFAPVTLLFGPNSVGKSSVLMALFYIQQILDKGHCDPVRIDALGERDIGGFAALVNGKNLDNSITLKVEYELGTSLGNDYATFADDVEIPYQQLLMPDISFTAEKVVVELEIAWTYLLNTAYVKRYAVWLDDEFAGQIESDAGLKKAEITAINFRHPLLVPMNHSPDNDEYMGFDWPDEPVDPNSEDAWVNDVRPIFTKFQEMLSAVTPGKVDENKATNYPQYTVNRRLGVKTEAGAIPLLGKTIETAIDEVLPSFDNEDYLNNLIIHRVLSQLFVYPLDQLKVLLKNSVCIGPIRTIPGSAFRPNPNPQQGDWIDGTAAWDLLHKCDSQLNAQVNHWLSAKKCFNSGYGLSSVVSKTFIEIKTGKSNDTGQMKQQLSELIGRSVKDEEFDDVRYQEGVVLYDLKNRITLAPNQVGSGISQIIPVVTAAHHITKGIVAVEQPELHIHPAFQVEVGDLFTQLDVNESRRPTFLIETHSEHLILRLLRRIRNTHSGALEDGLKPVRIEDVSVMYLSNDEGEVKIHKCPITEDGDFEYDWPNGFFVEREEEIFS
ncbi:AAA family ATPase [Amphritea sp.]|uniref:AAA family ATPase n=1 Tax=Amphritea sp. TaxID=1872502 RepID=UPI003A93774B